MTRLILAAILAAVLLALAYLAGLGIGLDMLGNPDRLQRLELGVARQAALERIARSGMGPTSRKWRRQADALAERLGLKE